MNYYGFDINTETSTKPWGLRERICWQESIRTLVGDTVTGQKDTSGHKHFRLYSDTSGEETLYCDSVKNGIFRGFLGIKSTPSNYWYSNMGSVIELYGQSFIGAISNYAAGIDISVNAIQSTESTWIHREANKATLYSQNGLMHAFYVADVNDSLAPVFFKNALLIHLGGIIINSSKLSGSFYVNGLTTNELFCISYFPEYIICNGKLGINTIPYNENTSSYLKSLIELAGYSQDFQILTDLNGISICKNLYVSSTPTDPTWKIKATGLGACLKIDTNDIAFLATPSSQNANEPANLWSIFYGSPQKGFVVNPNRHINTNGTCFSVHGVSSEDILYVDLYNEFTKIVGGIGINKEPSITVGLCRIAVDILAPKAVIRLQSTNGNQPAAVQILNNNDTASCTLHIYGSTWPGTFNVGYGETIPAASTIAYDNGTGEVIFNFSKSIIFNRLNVTLMRLLDTGVTIPSKLAIGRKVPNATLHIEQSDDNATFWVATSSSTKYASFRLFNYDNDNFSAIVYGATAATWDSISLVRKCKLWAETQGFIIDITGNYPLILGTNNSKRIYIDGSGIIGINCIPNNNNNSTYIASMLEFKGYTTGQDIQIINAGNGFNLVLNAYLSSTPEEQTWKAKDNGYTWRLYSAVDSFNIAGVNGSVSKDNTISYKNILSASVSAGLLINPNKELDHAGAVFKIYGKTSSELFKVDLYNETCKFDCSVGLKTDAWLSVSEYFTCGIILKGILSPKSICSDNDFLYITNNLYYDNQILKQYRTGYSSLIRFAESSTEFFYSGNVNGNTTFDYSYNPLRIENTSIYINNTRNMNNFTIYKKTSGVIFEIDLDNSKVYANLPQISSYTNFLAINTDTGEIGYVVA